MIIVDTSVLVDLFRGKKSPEVKLFLSLEESDSEIFIPAVCAQEVLQGAANESEWLKLHDYLWSQELLSPSNPAETHLKAARIFYLARRKGITIRSTIDCLIAQLAIENKASLLHSDRDFKLLAKVCPLKSATKFPSL
jgi:predicted nucleic acid-binding protein